MIEAISTNPKENRRDMIVNIVKPCEGILVLARWKCFVFILILSIIACSVNNQFYVTKFESYKIKVPKGYVNHKVISGNHGKELQFWYKDSMLFYFGNEYGISTPNSYNINNNQQMRNIKTKELLENDTFNLEGTTYNNFVWRECNYKNITIGYMNVPKDKKEIFDKAINSLCRKSFN